MNSPDDEDSDSPHGKIGFSPAFLKLTDASHQLGFKVACLGYSPGQSGFK